MHFKCIHLLSFSQIHPLHAYIPTHPPSVFFISFKTHQVQLWCPSPWGVGSGLEFGWWTRGHTIKEIGFPSPSKHQTPSAPQLAVRFFYELLVPPCWDFVWFEISQVCACRHNHHDFVCATAPLCPWIFTLISGSYNLLVSSSPKTPLGSRVRGVI